MLLSLFVPVSEALADARTDARRHFRAGMDLIRDGMVDAGVAELERAYESLPHPNVLYNIALAYQSVGRFDEAVEYFERYLESDPPDREEVLGIVFSIESTRDGASSAGSRTPLASEERTPLASEEDILALDAAADELEALAQSAVEPDETLRARAERLRAVARALRESSEDRYGASSTRDEPGGHATETGTRPSDSTSPRESRELEITEGTENLFDETVVSSTGGAQSALDAPNSITIITAQDIRLTGITNIGELLRRVVGADVMNLTGPDVQVGIRGLNQQLSPRVLTLIDGRQAYADALGANFFMSLPVSVEDIERIEVLRGPASALYGANGFSGIINIITREPGATTETGTSVGAGMGRTLRAQVWSSGRSSRFSYRLSAGYERYDRWERTVSPRRVDVAEPILGPAEGTSMVRAMGAMTYRISDDASLRLDASAAQGEFAFQAFGSLVDWQARGPSTYLASSLDTSWGSIQVWWNRLAMEHGVVGTDPVQGNFVSDTIDVEARFAREFRIGETSHSLTIGAGYRWKRIDWTFFLQAPTENHYRVVFQDAITLVDELRLVVGFRADRHPILEDPQFSPRVAVIVHPSEQHAVRTSYATAFRNPTLLETYMALESPTPVVGVTAANFGSEVAREVFGRERLRPERIQTGEIGYRFEHDRFDFDLALYYSRIVDLISISEIIPATISDYGSGVFDYLPSSASYSIGTTVFGNELGRLHAFGAETAVRVNPLDGLDIFVNYTHSKFWSIDNPRRTHEERTSAHKVNAGLQYRSRIGFDVSLDVHYNSSQVWLEEAFDPDAGLTTVSLGLPAFYLVNARIGWRLLNEELEIGIVGYNVTNSRHRQHPRGQRIDSRVVATGSYRF